MVGRADDEAPADALEGGAEHLARELGVVDSVVHHGRVGKAGAGPQVHVTNGHRMIRIRRIVRGRRRGARGDGMHLA